MKQYPKIQSIYKRNELTHKFIEGDWSTPEFEYLANNQWEWTEKVDGTNIRVLWEPILLPVAFRGKTDGADIPKFLLSELQRLFPVEKFETLFKDVSVCLYGEGYGARIQKGGGNYIPNGVSFVLFDVWISGWWLQRNDVVDIASKLGIDCVPLVMIGTIHDAINKVKNGYLSKWGNFPAEGLVGRTLTGLKDRKGERIITKLKSRDF